MIPSFLRLSYIEIQKKSRHLGLRVRRCETPPSLLTENFETIHWREKRGNSLHCLPPGKEFSRDEEEAYYGWEGERRKDALNLQSGRQGDS